MLCKDCKFWQPEDSDGICRRYPATPIIVESSSKQYNIISPRTKPDEFCGEFQEA